MAGIDLTIIGLFIAYAIYSGFENKEASSHDLIEYFLAGRSLPGWKAGISMAATQFAADTPLLVTGLIATAGIFSLWRLWVYALAFLLMGFVLGASWRRAGVLTDAELAELRYGSRQATVLRMIKAVYFGTIFNCTVLAMVLLAATRIAEPFLLWNEWLPGAAYGPVLASVQWLGVPLTVATGSGPAIWIASANNCISIGAIVLVTLFYSTTGGLRSVVQTDVVQFSIAIVATALYSWFVVRAVGGLEALPAKLSAVFAGGGIGGITPSQTLAFTPSQAKDAAWPVLTVLGIQWVAQMNADGTGYLAQRTMACRSDHDARVAAVVFTVAQVLLRSLIWLPIGLGLLILFPPDLSLPLEVLRADREATFARGIMEILPPGVKGLMLTGMLAALASTVDTHLNWGSSYWTNDIFKRLICGIWLKKEPSGRSLVWVARGANAMILILALIIMTQLSSIQTAWHTSLLLGAGMGVLLVLRWLWWRINAWGEISCIVISMLLAPILLAKVESEGLRLILITLASTGGGILVSLWTGPERMADLKGFFQRARPLGFWKPVAEALGEDGDAPARLLGRELLAVAAAAVGIFALLIGMGSWLCGSPPPTWFPWRTAWIALLLAVGAGMTPVWIRLGFPETEASRGGQVPR